jgi:hypothetical protein
MSRLRMHNPKVWSGRRLHAYAQFYAMATKNVPACLTPDPPRATDAQFLTLAFPVAIRTDGRVKSLFRALKAPTFAR